MMSAASIDRALAPVDAARARLLRALGPWVSRAILADREARVALTAAALGLTALVLTACIPSGLIALSPLVLGVPHLVSDLRYLVMQPGYHRRIGLSAIAVACLIGAAAGAGLRAALAGAVLCALFARAGRLRRVSAALGAACLLAATWRLGPIADAAFVQLHNLVAIVWWWLWRERRSKLHWLPLGLVAVGCAAILAGAFDGPALGRAHESPWPGIDAGSLSAALAPWAHGPFRARFVLLYAFGQSVHYAVWLRLVPDEARPSETPRSFRRSYRALCCDVGALALALAVAIAVALLLYAALTGVARARQLYLKVAFFHAYAEIILLAPFIAEGRRPAASQAQSHLRLRSRL